MKKIIRILSLTVLMLCVASAAAYAAGGQSVHSSQQTIPHQSINYNLVQGVSMFLQPLADWCSQTSENKIGFTLCTNSGNGVVSYATGILDYNSATGVFEGSDSSQYFNDRLWGTPVNGMVVPVNPFSPQKTDKINLKIDKNTGVAAITLKSWGNASATYKLKVLIDNQLLYGVDNPGVNGIMLSFKKITIEIPR